MELDRHVVARVTGQHTSRHRLADALVDGLDEVFRNRAADDVVDELVAFTRLPRDQANLRVAVLAAAARLPDVTTFAFGRSGQRVLVGNLPRPHTPLNIELALEPIDDDLQVELAHPGDDNLAGLLVRLHAER